MDLTAVEEDVFSGYLAGFTSLAGDARTRRLLDLFATEAILRDEVRRHGALPPRLVALIGRSPTCESYV